MGVGGGQELRSAIHVVPKLICAMESCALHERNWCSKLTEKFMIVHEQYSNRTPTVCFQGSCFRLTANALDGTHRRLHTAKDPSSVDV